MNPHALLLLPGLIVGITVHEFAHAWSAKLLGDEFPRRQGRVSLNPLRHLSLLGTLAIVLLPFGWGKPVGVNLYNFKRPRLDFLISSLAGPLANLLMTLVCVGVMFPLGHTRAMPAVSAAAMEFSFAVCYYLALINLLLAVFNLIPVPPLDGSKIWPCLFPGLKVVMSGKNTLVYLVFLGALLYTNALGPVLNYPLEASLRLFPKSDGMRASELNDAAIRRMAAFQYDQAESLLTQSLELDPRSDETYSLRSHARYYLNRLSEAMEDIDQAIRIVPRREYLDREEDLKALIEQLRSSESPSP